MFHVERAKVDVSRGTRGPGRVITVVNQKGGVGKTTTAVNLAAGLACAERSTLLVDLDPQGNATTGLGVRKEGLYPTIYSVLLQRDSIDRAFQPTALPTLSIVPADIDLVGVEIEGILLTMFDGRTSLAGQVKDEVHRFFEGQIFETIIPRNIRLTEAPSHGKPIVLYDLRSSGALAYLELTREVLSHE